MFLAQIIFPALMMEATYFSETSVDTQRTTRRYIPEDGIPDSRITSHALCGYKGGN
jgi:hypothetical protein